MVVAIGRVCLCSVPCRFTRAVRSQPSSELLSGWASSWLGPILMAIGYLFVVTSTLRLGIIGTFLGDYFGFLMKERITSFPFNVCTHPMYEGSTMIFLGYSLWYGSGSMAATPRASN